MNPEAVEWLESLDEWQHPGLFAPAIGQPGALYTIKPDHEPCGLCPNAAHRGQLVAIE